MDHTIVPLTALHFNYYPLKIARFLRSTWARLAGPTRAEFLLRIVCFLKGDQALRNSIQAQGAYATIHAHATQHNVATIIVPNHDGSLTLTTGGTVNILSAANCLTELETIELALELIQLTRNE